jgi:UDP-3-O-[3-hydroxymyristoyl] glucosamine N-acyltransferase
MKLKDLASALGGQVVGDGDIEATRPVDPEAASEPGDIAVAIEKKALRALGQTKARLAVVAENAKVPDGAVEAYVTAARPRLALAEITALFAPRLPHWDGIHPQAAVADGAQLANDVSLGAFSSVGEGAVVGAGTVIAENVTIGPGAVIGAECHIAAGVRIAHGAVIGDRVIIHHNAVVGSDGFSFTTPQPGSIESFKATGRIEHTNDEFVRVASVGTVRIGDDVEIGANSAIDRGTLKDTVIGRGTKIDNLVTVGHNVEVGENCMICGQVGIAGSAVIGDRVVLAGKVGVADHVSVGADVIVVAGSGIHGKVEPKSVMYGYPAMHYTEAVRWYTNIRRVHRLIEEVDALKHEVKTAKENAKDGAAKSE